MLLCEDHFPNIIQFSMTKYKVHNGAKWGYGKNSK